MKDNFKFLNISVIVLLPLLLFCIPSKATNYYFAANGSDYNNGTSASSPWQTINKLNSISGSLRPGDNVYFNRGDLFYGSIQVNSSGSSGSPITFGAYGNGSNPVISGFTSVNSWTNLGGNIWESSNSVSTLPTCNMVTINGVNTAMGRYPNTGYLYYQSHSGQNSITSSDLSGSTNWAGAELAFFVTTYTFGRDYISSQSGNTLVFNNNPKDDNIQRDNQGFFIQNDPRTLDVPNEWYYNPNTNKLRVYSIGTPSNVQLASVETLMNVAGKKSYITIDGISFQGGNTALVQLMNTSYTTVQNCDFNFSGNFAISGPYGGPATNLLVQNCTINNANGSGIDLSGDFTNATVQNNNIKNAGSLIGMGGNVGSSYNGISAIGTNSLIKGNTISNSGYKGINFAGNNSVVQNNLLDGFCLLLHDGAGIYTYNGKGATESGIKITGNIVLNGTTNPGIYTDELANNIEISNNTVANCSVGIYVHNNWSMNVLNNTTYNNNFVGLSVRNDDPNTKMYNIVIQNNIFAAMTTEQNTSFFDPAEKVITEITANYNYYAKPIDDNHSFIIQVATPSYDYQDFSLANWQKYSGGDANSNNSPKAITDIRDLRFEYNATSSSKTISLDGNYIDVKNTSYNGSITLAPFSSAVLIRNGAATNQSPSANAGSDQTITLPTSAVYLSGSGSDPDGSISAYKWTQISGPASATITSSTAASTNITGLIQGTYQFQLQVTDNVGATATDNVQVIVNPLTLVGNSLPTANAGSDQTINLPTSTINLSGSGTDTDGSISAYAWTQISGPSSGTISSATSASTSVTGLVQGVYQFQLQVTDNSGATVTDVVQITVNALSLGDLLPAINAGNTISGLNYKYYEGSSYDVIPDFTALTPVKTGTIANFDISPANRSTIFAFSFTGYINIPTDGQYNFYTTSDDGSNLFIDGVQVVNNDGRHGSQEQVGTIGLKAGMHAISVGYFQQTGNAILTVNFEGPGISKQAIPSSALYSPGTSTLLPAINAGNTISGLNYKYYEGSSYDVIPDFTTLTPVKTGTIANFDISPANRSTIFAFSFTGYINIPTDGQYNFYTTSDDGSNLFIDGVQIVNNDGQHGSQEKVGTIGLKAGMHTISVGYFQQTGAEVLNVNYEGPGISKQAIPSSALYSPGVSGLLSAINPGNTVNGLNYKYYEGSSYDIIPDFSALTPVETGTTAIFDISPANRSTIFALSFTGYIYVFSDGQYTFYTSSDDGSNLFIDGVQVVNNDGRHAAQEKSGTIGLKAGFHAISVGYFQQTGSDVLTVSYSGPGVTKQVIPNWALFRLADLLSVSGNRNTIISSAETNPNSASAVVKVKAYPNPFDNFIKVDINGASGQYQLDLVDALGRTLLTKNGTKSEGNFNLTLNTSSLERGVYFIRVTQNNKKSVIKVIK